MVRVEQVIGQRRIARQRDFAKSGFVAGQVFCQGAIELFGPNRGH